MDAGSKVEPRPARDEACVREDVESIAARLETLVTASGRALDDLANGLAGIERDLDALLPDLATADGAVLERESPAVRECARWHAALVSRGLHRAADSAAELLADLLADDARRWREGADETVGRPEAEFRELQRASARLIEVLDLGEHARAANAILREGRDALRARLVEARDRGDVTPAMRSAWAEALSDRANDTLTSIDGLAPLEAASHLETVRDDIAWHVETFEPEGGRSRARLDRRMRRLSAEYQERVLSARLESRFGERAVRWWEAGIVVLIFLFLGLIGVELFATLTPAQDRLVLILDTAACAVFLWDFFFKWALVRFRFDWFRRHVLVDLLPSIPYALLLHVPALDTARASRGARLLRLPRLARYLRLLMPAIRVARAFGFLARGFDRVVRRYGHLLNHDIVLHPTRAERGGWARGRDALAPAYWRTAGDLAREWERLLDEAEPRERERLASLRTEALVAAREAGHTEPARRRPGRGPGAERVVAEELLRRVQEISPEELSAELGRDVTARIAGAVRLFSRWPLRWFPYIRHWVPSTRKDFSPEETAARAARHAAHRLQDNYDRILWFADLYGTVTPSELVDRVGSTLVKRTSRPAYRLLMFGGFYLLVWLLLVLLDAEGGDGALNFVEQFLRKTVGSALLVLGTLCSIMLVLGWWMKRIASKATSYYDQVAAAQFLNLLDAAKTRHHERDAEIFERRLFAPEARLRGEDPRLEESVRTERFLSGLHAVLLRGRASSKESGTFDPIQRALLLYRDAMDGALLAYSDTRITNQLLGNLALRHMRDASRLVSKRDRKALAALDLAGRGPALRGPYLWFSFVTQAIAQSAARLVVDYNQSAIPLEEIESASREDRERFERWLATDEGTLVDPALAERSGLRETHLSTSFHVLHFVDDDPERDQEVADRFGDEVLAALRRDRVRLFRRIFGSYPLHTLPSEQRILNLRQAYHRWLEGGRALFLPLTLTRRMLRQVAQAIGFVARAVSEIKNPRRLTAAEEEAQDDFTSGMRKIDRMRAPAAQACLWQRAIFDVEYLGVPLPGEHETTLDGHDVEDDLAFLDAAPEWNLRIRRERVRAEADVRRLEGLIAGGLLDRVARRLGREEPFGLAHLRVASLAYRADYHGLRSLLSASEILEETRREVERVEPPPGHLISGFALARAYGRYRASRDEIDPELVDPLWRAIQNDENGAAEALRTWDAYDLDEARERGEEILTELLRHPGRITEELLTLRAIQTLSLIDILDYRSHVWRLGGYAENNERPRSLLALS